MVPDDRKGLGYIKAGPHVIGFVDAVNGPGGVEHREYHPSVHELTVLAQYWLRERLSSLTSGWLMNTVGSHDLCIRPYSARRLARIARILGKKRFQQLVREAEVETRERLG